MPAASRTPRRSAPRGRGARTLAAVTAALLLLTLLATAPPAAATDGLANAPSPAPWTANGISANGISADGVGADEGARAAELHRQRVAAADPAGWAAAAAAGTRASDAVPGELIVTTAGTDGLAAGSWQSLQRGGYVRARPLADGVTLVTTDPARIDDVAAALQQDPAVLAVEPNMRRQFLAAPDDTSYGLQWAHRQTDAETAWDTFTGQGAPPLIAILDSGADATHPDLEGIIVSSLRAAGGVVTQGQPVNDECPETAPIGHGTAVTGMAAARGDNGTGVAGALWEARVIDVALRSLENNCSGPHDADVIAAMGHLSDLAEPPLVMNLSFAANSATCTAGYRAAIQEARTAGIVVVAAAGNDGSSRTTIPASCDGVISVGATTVGDERAPYSQTNPQVDIAAPGGHLPSPVTSCPSFADLVAQFVVTTSLLESTTVISGCPDYTDPNGDRLQGTSGTSFAAPYVAGAVGLLRQLAIEEGAPLGVDDVEAILQASARDVGATGRDCQFGFGILDLGAAVGLLTSGARPGLQTNPSLGSGSCTGGGTAPPPSAGSCPVTQAGVTSGFVRFAADGVTTPICQAVAVARQIPDGQAPYAVLARADDFADALAGSAVGLGLGPLLFTSSTGGLDPQTRAELQRVLRVGEDPPIVFIMGGVAAVPAAVDDELAAMGMTPVRLAGDGREATAVAASQTVELLKAEVDFPTRDYAFVAFGRNWPDAVGAGQMAAHHGVPVLVTNGDSLHPQTRAELARLEPSQVFVLGGDAVIDQAVEDEIRDMGLEVSRLAGDGRVDTTLAVSDVLLGEIAADAAAGEPVGKPAPVALNLDDNFNDVLSASLIGGLGNIYVPLAGDGTIVTAAARARVCDYDSLLFVIGGTDRIPDAAATELVEVLQGQGC